MSSKAKKTRRIKRAIGNIARFFVIAGVIYGAVVWARPYYPRIEGYFKRFGLLKIDTRQIDRYWDLLSKYQRSGPDLVLGLGIKDGTDLQLAIDRLKSPMGLQDKKMALFYRDVEKPPAYVTHTGLDDIKIFLSNKITQRREQINLLVHEIAHIYAWRLEGGLFGACDQEKLVDCSGVFLGLGVLILNGLTDEATLSLGGGYETRQKFFGYLKPEQFGYLFARYCREHGVASEAVMPFLNPTGRKYFIYGRDFLDKRGLVPEVRSGSVTGIYWCPSCGNSTKFELKTKISSPKCSSCGAEVASTLRASQ